MAIYLEWRTYPDPDPDAPWVADMSERERAHRQLRLVDHYVSDPNANEYVRRRRILDAIRIYEGLAQVPQFEAEALVRIAALRVRLREPAAARAVLQGIDHRVADSRTRYLSSLIAGQAFEQQGDTGQAIRAYEEAVAALPHAFGAALSAAALLFLEGLPDELRPSLRPDRRAW